MRKALKWLVAIAILGGGGWVAYQWFRATESSDVTSLIPSSAIYCVATNHPIESWKEISGSSAWRHLQSNAYFSSLTSSVNSLDSTIRDNDFLFRMIGSRELWASAHAIGPRAYDFLFSVDLGEASGIKFLNEYLTDLSAGGLTLRKEPYEGNMILILTRPGMAPLFISMPGHFLVASFTKQLVIESLDAGKDEGSLALTSLTTFEGPADDELLRLYVNYKRLPELVRCYSEGPNEYAETLSRALRTSSLTMSLEKEMIKAVGPTFVNDSVESYLKTLLISGKAGNEITEIAPRRTAFYLGFGFTSFHDFFSNFEKNIKQDVKSYDEYRQNLKQAEEYLKINLQQNFIDWIGDEVVLLELQSAGKGIDKETAVVLKSDNIEKAKKDLAYIEKMIRRRTPVKFKTVDHRGFAINYLSMKGLFKVLFGKFFARYDKPHYTVINNFVIFSNHPQTLESVIDDYLAKNTLSKSVEFRAFRKQLDDEQSVLVYVNTPVLFNTMKKLANTGTRASMEQNRDYIVCFRHLAFQLTPAGDKFNTILAEQFSAPEGTVATASLQDPQTPDTVVAEQPAVIEEVADTDPMALPYIYVQDLNARSYTGYYPDSTVNYRVEIRNGFKDGSYTEYHSNGKVKMTGRFRKDKRDGTWKLYSESGDLVMKRNYDDGEVTKERSK